MLKLSIKLGVPIRLFVCLSFLMISIRAVAGGGHGHGSHGSHEEGDGLIRITDVGIETSGIVVRTAKETSLPLSLIANGYVVPNEYQTSYIRPRYSGIVRKVFAKLGQPVKKGEILATIEANGSETNFSVIAGFSGTIIEKDLIIGQFVSTSHVMFQVSDLKIVWVELSIPENYAKKMKQGIRASITNWDGKDHYTESKISYLSSTIYEDSQSILARLELDNSTAKWRPGTFVEATIYLESALNVISVEKGAIQTLEENNVVFIEVEEGVFRPQPVRLGRSNPKDVEITSGLVAGDRYVASSSYILKADFLKSEASHEH